MAQRNRRKNSSNAENFESSFDLLVQLRNECEQDRSSDVDDSAIRAGAPRWVVATLCCVCAIALVGCGALGHLLTSSKAETKGMLTQLAALEEENLQLSQELSVLQTLNEEQRILIWNLQTYAQTLRNVIEEYSTPEINQTLQERLDAAKKDMTDTGFGPGIE